MKWQSEEHVDLAEAAEWARHFGQLELDMDSLLAKLLDIPREILDRWIKPGRYVTGREFAEAGMAELLDLHALAQLKEISPPSNNGNGAAQLRKTAETRE